MSSAAPVTLLADVLRSVAVSAGARPALTSAGRGQVTYDDLVNRISDASSRLQDVRPGDVVAVGIDPLDDFVTWYFAVLACGGVVVPAILTDRSADDVLARTGASRTANPTGQTSTTVDPTRRRFFADQGAAVVTVTAGTTGHPKLVAHSHRGLLWNLFNTWSVQDLAMGLDPTPPTGDGIIDTAHHRLDLVAPLGLSYLCGMPPTSITGISLINRALLSGETLCLTGTHSFDVTEVHNLLRNGAANTLALSPLMAELLIRQHEASGGTIGVLGVGLGGGAVPEDLAHRLEESFSCVATVGYGSTETGGPIAVTLPTDDDDRRHSTVGRPLPAVDVRLRSSAFAGIAELECRTPAAMLCEITETGAVRRPNNWIRVGDLASIDDRGFLRLHGRVDATIVRGGQRIDPVEVERVLETHPSVDRAAVLGIDGRVVGEQDLVAIVDASARLTLVELRRLVRDVLGAHASPQRLVEVDTIPLTRDGSVRRHLLEELARARGHHHRRPGKGSRYAAETMTAWAATLAPPAKD